MFVALLYRGRETDMMQGAFVVIKAEQERTDLFPSFMIAEPADYTIGAAVILDLLHAVTFAGSVFHVAPFGDDSIERVSNLRQTTLLHRECWS